MCRRWPLDEWEAEQAEAEEAARPEGELAGAIVEGLIMERAEEEGAAAKVQAIHRGNQSRKGLKGGEAQGAGQAAKEPAGSKKDD